MMMMMMKSSSTPALVIFLLLLVIGAPTMTSAQCNIGNLQPCLPAVTSSAMPTPGCCNVLRSQKPCFCGYLKNPTFKKYYSPSVASKISNACKIPIPKC